MKHDQLYSSSADWLNAHVVPDDAMAEAYESLGNEGRAVLKKCIARLYRLWGEMPLRQQNSTRFSEDFCVEVNDVPSPYALFICEASYASPAALLAALMPAVLAGVGNLLPCFVPDENSGAHGDTAGSDTCLPVAAPLLAALELAGVERAFCASTEQSEKLLSLLYEEEGPGCLVILGKGSFGHGPILAAHEKGLNSRSLCHSLRYYDSARETPMIHCFRQEPREGLAGADRDKVDNRGPEASEIFLHLDAEHAGVWVWPDLSPAWFRSRQMLLTS